MWISFEFMLFALLLIQCNYLLIHNVCVLFWQEEFYISLYLQAEDSPPEWSGLFKVTEFILAIQPTN